MERERNPYRRHQPSFFWPIALITVGIVWLLVNNGTIPVENLYRLFPFWPVLLILAGISLLLQRIWWPLAGLLWGASAALFVWALLSPPAFLPPTQAPELRRETFSEPLNGVQSASIDLELSGSPNRVFALEDSDALIDVNATYIDEMQFDVSGSAERNVLLNENRTPQWGIVWFSPDISGQRPWEVGLSPSVPLRLKIDTSAGATTLDLQDLEIESLNLAGGSGNIELNLPDNNQRLLFTYTGGSGSLTVNAPVDANFELELDGGSGNIVINMPDEAAVQVEVRDDGSGVLRLPPGFTQVRDGDGDEGLWESEAYGSARNRMNIIIDDQGSGDIEIR